MKLVWICLMPSSFGGSTAARHWAFWEVLLQITESGFHMLWSPVATEKVK